VSFKLPSFSDRLEQPDLTHTGYVLRYYGRVRIADRSANAVAVTPRPDPPVSGHVPGRHPRLGWRGWRKHVERRLRRLKPDDLGTKIGVVVFAGVGVLVLYLWGTPGLYAAVVLTVLVVFVVGVASRFVKRVVRATRSRKK
jgi:hypothetical protein